MKILMLILLTIPFKYSIELEPHPLIKLDRATTYYCNEKQCDNNPFTTADGSVINPDDLKNNKIRWCALSRDLIWDEYRQTIHSQGFRGLFKFGDTIEVYSKSNPQINGKWVIHDTMNKRYTYAIDFLIHPSNNKIKLGVCQDVIIINKPTKGTTNN